jgi:small GTP-binding protein
MEEGPLSFKIIVIGDSGTGKTSLIRKYIHGAFKDEYEVTVGVDFSSKTVTVDEQPVQLQIWDTVAMVLVSAARMSISQSRITSTEEQQQSSWSTQ